MQTQTNTTMTKRITTGDEPPTHDFAELVRMAILKREEAGLCYTAGDICEEIHHIVARHRGLRDAAIDYAIRNMVSEQRGVTRASAKDRAAKSGSTSPLTPLQAAQRGVDRRAAGLEHRALYRLWTIPYLGGTVGCIGKATVDDLQYVIDQNDKQIGGLQHNNSVYIAMRDILIKSKKHTVEEGVPLAQLEALDKKLHGRE